MAGTAVLILLAMISTVKNAAASYEIPSYETVLNQLNIWEAKYPDLVQVWDAQTQYGLSSAGTCLIAGSKQPCKQWFIRITNERTLSNELDRPHVFYSGNLHGNEQVGPPVLLDVAGRMLQAAEAAQNPKGSSFAPESATAWLARMVDTRVTVILVVSNPIGHEQRVRTEVGLDPNRDFAHDVRPSDCMNTVAARAVNEVFRSHLFQSGIT